MFIVNLMASVLALAMVGASTTSVSKIENNAVLSAENTSFVVGIRKPLGVYGSDDGSCYNYLGVSIVVEGSTYSADAVIPTSITAEEGSAYLYLWDSEQNNTDQFVVPADFVGGVDFYLNGVFVSTITPNSNHRVIFADFDVSSVYVPPDDAYHTFSDFYLWLFPEGVTPELEPYTPVDMLGDIAEGLTGGIVPVAEGIGNGLQSLVQDIFLNADHDGLSVFGIVIVCFAGLALALGLSRWVLNFVDTLGARDR